ncbi:hypothetical protein [Emticicia sp.]|uniref:hypothetical protein n=1 Tax=Emticicia sp. TaxID=1930953 RepID=UPI0037529790
MKKSFLLAAIALTTLVAPATFAKGGVKKQTPKQEAKAQKKQEKIAVNSEKKEAKPQTKAGGIFKKNRHHKAKKAA